MVLIHLQVGPSLYVMPDIITRVREPPRLLPPVKGEHLEQVRISEDKTDLHLSHKDKLIDSHTVD